MFFSSNLNPFADKLVALAEISSGELLNFTNQERTENGLPALSLNSQLEDAANKKADDMFEKNYWSHNSPVGTTPWVFIKESGYDYVYAGENLARGFSDSKDVINAWMASSTHRENILSANFKDVGFSVKSGKLNGEETFLVVQELGSKSVVPVAGTSAEKQPAPDTLGFSLESFVNKPSISFSYEFVILLILGFIGVLLVDLIVAKRIKIVRFVGHNIDHAIFLVIIIFVITILSTGSVL